jgi:glycosyltransferase involved in cell wall biosynthesis
MSADDREAAGAPQAASPEAGRRLRVLHVIDSLAGSGGAENRLVDEVIALRDRCDQTVLRLFERDFLEGRLREAGVPVIALGHRAGHAGRTWPVVGHRVAGVVRDVRPDLVHTSLFTGNLVGQLAGARRGVPVVSTFNRTGEARLQRELQPGVASWKGKVMQSVGRRAARLGDVHFRAVGEYARRTNCAQLGLPLDHATVVHRGVALAPPAAPEGEAQGRAAFGLPDGVPLFVNVARLVPEKAQHLLVEAFALARADLPDAHLAIAGAEGPASAAVAAAVERAGVGEAVSLLGFRADARDLVAAGDVFAFSSASEGSPGAVVEAMMLGTPVAAFAIAPVAELTGDGDHAWLAEPGDPAALAAAMLAAYGASDRAERAAAAQRWAEKSYALEAVADQLADLFDERVARYRSRGRR